MRCTLLLTLLLTHSVALYGARASEPPIEAARPAGEAPNAAASAEPQPKSVAELTALVRKSVVVVSFAGRDGRESGLGSGFVISRDGLIATNLHVIGEARPITVQTEDGRSYDVTEIHATDHATDLAVIRIDARDLEPLVLGNPDTLRQGQQIVALGNPRGLRHSVVAGVVSGRRDVDGRSMIQLAVPVEQGNSGGPVLDLFGRVHGILSLKSLVAENVGFAQPVDALGPLLESPNPVPMARWLTIGALDPRRWTALFGARWRQRAGRIQVSGQGQGFGGRSILLWSGEPPEPPFEVAVEVKLDQADGAAGLVFHSDGEQQHYGFYPSSGSLRLSRFDGPDVFRWQVLEQVAGTHYRPGEWNTIKVRVEPDRIRGYVNDELVAESADRVYTSGKVGLAKFRHTTAEFRNFRVAKELPLSQPSAEAVARIRELAAELTVERPPDKSVVEKLLPESAASRALRDEARILERRAERLLQLADAVHAAKVRGELADLLQRPEAEIDLLRAALLVARLDNEELDGDAYVAVVDRMADEIRETFPADAGDPARLAALDKYLFEELGFHGSRTSYYHRSNSYLNEVLDDREGLPIMLSLLYIELSRRLDLKVVGVGLPGHFIVRHEPVDGDARGEAVLIDPFDRGARLTREAAVALAERNTGRPFEDEFLRAQTKREIIVRVLRNLQNVSGDERDLDRQLRYVETLVAIEPDSAEFRAYRTDLRMRTQRLAEAIEDVDWFLEEKPPGADLERLQELRDVLEARSTPSAE
jgi:regulator of sirC expression with transglutaminase-like and TPR domain